MKQIWFRQYYLVSNGIIAPFNDVFQLLQASLSEKAPYLIMGVIGIISAVPGLFLPETADVKFPESLQDVENFGK